MGKYRRFALYAWGNVFYNLAVILWGAFVRATGSGAGCGDHWPLCNGEVIPRADAIETMIEFAHRLSSGVALLAVIGLVVWAYRLYPKGSIVRRGAAFACFFMFTEALLGAGLVLFQLVAHNESIARVYSIAAHLVNTFLLVAALTLTAWWATGYAAPRLKGQGPLGIALIGGLLATLLIGVTGAVIALGDTLFFAHLDRGGSEANLTPFVEGLTQLRIVHPFVAVLGSIIIGILGWQVARVRPSAIATRLAWAQTALIIIQLLVGVLNVYLKVPVAIQLIHLLLADLIWITMVLISAAALAVDHPALNPRNLTNLNRAPA
jgi:heme A synthase